MGFSWGESAGAISVALQMVTNGGNTEGLFRGAFMQSGGPIPRAGTVETGSLNISWVSISRIFYSIYYSSDPLRPAC